MCSRTLNHSDSLRGECADHCASPCCLWTDGEIKRERKLKWRNKGIDVRDGDRIKDDI